MEITTENLKQENVSLSKYEINAVMSLITLIMYCFVHWPIVHFFTSMGVEEQIATAFSTTILISIISLGCAYKNGYQYLIIKIDAALRFLVSKIDTVLPNRIKILIGTLMLLLSMLLILLITIAQIDNLQLKTSRVLSNTLPNYSLTTWKINNSTENSVDITIYFKPINNEYKEFCANKPCRIQLDYQVTSENIGALSDLVKNVDSAIAKEGTMLDSSVKLTKLSENQTFGMAELGEILSSHGLLGFNIRGIFMSTIMPLIFLIFGIHIFYSPRSQIKKLITSFLCLVFVGTLTTAPLIALNL